MKSRLISVILVLIMVTSLTPAAALAADVTPEPMPTETTEPVSSEAPEPTPGPTTTPEPTATPEPSPEATVSPEPETEPEETPVPSGEAVTQAEAEFTLNEADTDYTYTINSDSDSVTITGYSGSGGNITIPGSLGGLPVTAIGESAFKGNSSITSVTIPDSVTTIKDSAFMNCSHLESIVLPSGISTISAHLFEKCSDLDTVSIPSGVTSIGDYAFYGNSLDSMSFPAGLRTIGQYAFYDCYLPGALSLPSGVISIGAGAFKRTSIASVIIPDGVTSIAMETFADCSKLTGLTIPSSVTSIGESAFEYSTLKTITIPDSVERIDKNAFFYCQQITDINLPQGLETISEGMLSNCTGLKSIEIPESVTTLEKEAFFNCYNLTSIVIPGSVETIGEGVFNNCDKLATVTLSDGITSIPDKLFQSCHALSNITIPDSVTKIGQSAFSGCWALESIHIPDTVTEIGDEAFSYAGLKSFAFPSGMTSTGTSLLSHCGELTNISFPASITSIGTKTFNYCNGLKSVTIPDTVTSIGDSAFAQCTGLISVSIPASVTGLGNSAFASCESLTSVTIPASVTTYGGSIFGDCTALSEVNLPGNMTTIPNNMFYNCESISSIDIPDNVVSIGGKAFRDCTSLAGIELPSGVVSLGYEAFRNCASLTSIVLPENLTSLGDGSFSGCNSLASINIPDGITSIGEALFMNCYALKSVSLPDGVRTIGQSAFSGSAITSINLPNSVTSISQWAFRNCASLKSISLPADVTSLPYEAFRGCSSLKSVSLPSGLKSVTDGVFRGCSSLESINLPMSLKVINQNCFYDCTSLKSVTITSSIARIFDYAFYNCTALERIDFPDDLTITQGAFYNCVSLKSLTFPAKTDLSVSRQAFVNCTGLKSIYFLGNAPTFSNGMSPTFGNLADGCTIYYLAGSTGFTNPWQGYPTAVYEAGEEIVNVTGVTLDIHSKTITEGNSFALSATVLPEDATDPDVTWASSDETVAVVDANGLVTGIGPGRTTITAAAGSQEDSCEVTVAPVSTTNYLSGCYIRFDDGTGDGVTGNCYGTPCAIIPSSVINLQMPNRFGYCVLEPITTDEDNLYEITYGTETVSNNLPYFVFMPNPGTKTYTVVVHPAEGEQRSYTVNITRTSLNIDVESVRVDSHEENLAEGETVALNAQVLPVDATDPGVTWTSSDETVATVDENGLVTAISAGTARITAAAGEASDYCDVTVEPLSTTNYLRSCYVYCEGMTIDGVDGEFNSENGSIITNPVINLLVPNSVTECLLEPMTTDEDNLYDIIDGDETVSVNEPYAVQMPQAGVRTLTVLIRPAEGEQRTYTVNITRAVAEGKASAYSIQWSSDYDSGSVLDYINVPFEAGRYVYDVTVPYALEHAQLSAYPSDAGTVCRVYRNGDQVVTVGTATVDFAVGRNVVEVVFTDGAGVKKTYTYTVYRRGLDSLLDIQYLNMASVLSTNRTDEYQPMWLEDFNGESLSYSLNLPNAADRIVFDPILASEDATVDVEKGSSVVNDSGGGYASGLEVGENVFAFTVSHPSVDYTKTYTVTVMRAAQDDANAELCNLLIGSQQVDGFDGDEMEYDVTSHWGEEISPVTADANATYEIYEDGELAAVNEPAECPVWSAVMTVVVTAGDGVTARTYTLNVNDESDAELAELSLYDTHDNTGYQSDFGLQDGVYAYTADTVFANSTPILNISMKSDEQSVAVYQGRKLLARGADSHLTTGLNLDTGLNTYTIVVTAADGETQHAYTISITRAAKPAVNNANIARASLWLGTEWTYTEFLSSADTDYQFSVGRSAGQAGFSATLESASATCRAYLNNVLLADSNRSMLEFLPVSEGSNTLRLVVTAEDGVTTKTYNISINREVSDLNQLELISAPVKTVYKVGESLNLTGLSVTAHYASGYRKVLNGGDVQTSGYDSRTDGTQTVTVTYQGKSAMFDVTVNAVRVSGVTLSSTAETLDVGATISLKATVAPDDASYPAVTWTSSNSAAATVDTNGKVKAVGEGSATITAAADGMSDTCLVQVQRKRVESVSLNSSYSDMPIGTTLALVATVSPADATDRTVTWTSSNTAVATVNQNGLVTGVGDGKASITARADGKSAVCTVNVHATYRINPSSSSDGSTTGGGVYAYNSVVTIQAFPKADYYFKYWTENDVVISTEPVLSVAVTSNRSIHAIFERIGKPSVHTLRAASNTSLYAAWTDVSGATSYEVWRSVTPARDYTLIGTTGSTNYTDTGLQTNVIYYYRVKAVCAGKTATTYGDFSYAVSARAVPAAPAVGVSPAGYNTAWVTWNAVAGATKYEVWRSTNSVGGYKKISTVSASKLYYKNTGLSPGTVYYYQVRAYQKSGRTIVYGEFSSPVSVQTTLGAVTGARAVRTKAGTIKLSWSAVSGKSKYEVWRSTSPNGGFALVTTTGSTSFTNKGLAQGVTYYYQIRAYRLIGKIKAYGGYSAVVSAIA